jgi:hypothetical protein
MPMRSRAGGLGLVAIVAMAGAVGAQSPAASPGISPLPVRVVEGTCDAPGATLVELSEAIGTSPRPETQSIVHVSISEVPDPIEDLAAGDRSILVGGTDVESAVACAELGQPQADGSSVAALTAQHDSGHAGAIIMRRSDGGTLIEVVLVSPASPPAAPSPSAGAESAGPPSPGPSDPGISPVRSPQPGTSGAPPFSPLPQA